jgi:hypothetical protein
MASSTETSPFNLGIGKFILCANLPFVPKAFPAMAFLIEKKDVRKKADR